MKNNKRRTASSSNNFKGHEDEGFPVFKRLHQKKSKDLLRKKLQAEDSCPWLTNKVLHGIPAFLALVLYLNTLPAGFVYDDHRAVLGNPDVLGTTPLESIWGHDYWGAPLDRKGSHGSWRPLTTLSFRLNARFASQKKDRTPQELYSALESVKVSSPSRHKVPSYFKSRQLSPWSFHTLNVLLHSSVTAAFTNMLRTALISKEVCLAAGILFAVHPIHVEAVASVTGRAELLSALAFCLALAAYLEYLKRKPCWQVPQIYKCSCPYSDATLQESKEEEGLKDKCVKTTWLITSIGATALGFMCKEQAITAIGVAATYHSTLSVIAAPKSKKARLKNYQHVLCHDMLNNNSIGGHYKCWTRLAAVTKIERPEHIVLSLALLLIPFIPASNLVAWVGFVVAERVMYLPSMGFALLVAIGADNTWKYLKGVQTRDDGSNELCCRKTPHTFVGKFCRLPNEHRILRRAFFTFVLLLVLACSGRTFKRNLDWYDEETLYSSGVSINPPKALTNLGVVYSDAGRYEEAEAAYRAALVYASNMAETYYNLGLVLSTTGKTEEALQCYKMALKIRPWLAEAHIALAAAYQQLGQIQPAVQILEMCSKVADAPAKNGFGHASAVTTCRQRLAQNYIVKGRPKFALNELVRAINEAPLGFELHGLYTLMAEAYVEMGEHYEAQMALSRALSNEPDHVPAYLTLSRLLKANGSRFEEAERWIRRAVAIAPDDPGPHQHLGQLLLEQGRAEEAAVEWLKAASLDPKDHTSAFNAATSLRISGQNHHAESFYRRAVALLPEDVSSLRNLGAILHLNGKLDEALEFYKKALSLAPNDPQTMTNLQRLYSLIAKNDKV